MLVLVGMLAATPAAAQDVAIESTVYLERTGDRASAVEPAARLMRGDRVITIVRWDAPRDGSFTVTAPVPASLALQSASHSGLEVSTDGGRSWRRLVDPEAIPRGTTHLRWQVGGDGRLSYRAVVR